MTFRQWILVATGVLAAGRAVAQGYEVGVAAYTFRSLTAYEAIEQTRACGGDVIELFLWQKLSPAQPNVALDENLSDEQVDALKAKLQASGVRAVNAYFNNAAFQDPATAEARLRKLFAFARRLGLRGLTGEPPAEQLDLVERLVKEYDVRLCFHNHPKDDRKPEYRNWDPAYLLKLMDGRDPRMGFSLDTGHITRSGLEASEVVKLLGARIHSVHLKDVKERTRGSVDLPYGQGVGNMAAVLAELKKIGFHGHVAVEYENVGARLNDDVKACLAFIRSH